MMGIVCSGPSKNFIIPTMKDESDAFRELVVVRISDEGFSPRNLTLYEGQCISFEWKGDVPSQVFNVIQVSGVDQLNQVPGGYKSGDVTQSGSFKVCVGRKGQLTFASESLPDRMKTLKVEVLEKHRPEIKITGQGFESHFVHLQEGETVQWTYKNGDSEVPCYLQEIGYCFEHGGFLARKSRFEVKSAHRKIFQDTGLYLFYLDMCDDELKDLEKVSMICVVKVTQKKREFLIDINEEVLQPKVISARVQDRIWLNCSTTKNINSCKILNAYVYKEGASSSPLVSSTITSSFGSRMADLISYQFTEPGLYHYLYKMADLSQFRGCVVVKPQPTEHVMSIHNGQFKPSLATVKKGERVWWTFNDDENLSLFLKEVERCAPLARGLPARQKSSTSGCGCKRLKDQASVMNSLGLITHKFEDMGVFTYRFQDDSNSPSLSSYCSVIVESKVKHHTVDVRDQGFTPRILNVHPGDWVWWQWENTERFHNILQVTHQRTLVPDGFSSGKASCSSSAFSNTFTELGVVYFASKGLPEVFGAVVVTPQSKIHKIHLTSQGIHPDPLVISPNDCVCWRWFEGESFSVQKISQPDDAGIASEPPQEDYGKRCFSRVFSKPGMYHFLCTAHHLGDEEVRSQRTDSFVHTILVDPVSYSSMVGVTADGFEPATVTIAKSQSVLWTWENQSNEEHNILHVRPPQADQPLTRVRGISAFDSGPVTSSSTFFHTFDIPGRYFITSEGTNQQLCTIDVMDNAIYVSPPKIPDTERDGGNVENGYRVLLKCDTVDAEIYYSTNGSYPVECNVEVLRYNNKKGIVLGETGFFVIRAVAKKQGWVTSQVFTSKRFWVLEVDDEAQEESSEEEDQHLGNDSGSEELDLKTQILNWHWLSCLPSISVELVCDNSFNIDISLGNAADVAWIRGFQLYLNGISYGGWFNPHCRGLVVSGLIGGKVYHVVLVVFSAQESFEPQLSNEVVISCPTQSSSGGALVSLEASSTPQSLVIVWPVQCDPRTTGIIAYSVLINGQPFGEQIIPEPRTDYCRVLFESNVQKEVYTLCVASHLSGTDLILYSNEVEFSLPVPHEILSALQANNVQDDSTESCEGDDGSPARELLLVAERVYTRSSEPEQSRIGKFSMKSNFGRLQTIPEDQQLNVVVVDNEVMEDIPLQSVLNTTEDGECEANSADTQAEIKASNGVEGRLSAIVDEDFVVVADETDLDALPYSFEQVPYDSQGVDEGYEQAVDKLDEAIFRDLSEIISEKEPLADTENVCERETQSPLVDKAHDVDLGEASHVKEATLVVVNKQDHSSALSQPDTLEYGTGNQTHEDLIRENDVGDVTVHKHPEENIKTEAFDKDENPGELNVSGFWNQEQMQDNEGSVIENDLTTEEHDEVSDHTLSKNEAVCHLMSENVVCSHKNEDNAANDENSDEGSDFEFRDEVEKQHNEGSIIGNDVTSKEHVKVGDYVVSEACRATSENVVHANTTEKNADGHAAEVNDLGEEERFQERKDVADAGISEKIDIEDGNDACHPRQIATGEKVQKDGGTEGSVDSTDRVTSKSSEEVGDNTWDEDRLKASEAARNVAGDSSETKSVGDEDDETVVVATKKNAEFKKEERCSSVPLKQSSGEIKDTANAENNDVHESSDQSAEDVDNAEDCYETKPDGEEYHETVIVPTAENAELNQEATRDPLEQTSEDNGDTVSTKNSNEYETSDQTVKHDETSKKSEGMVAVTVKEPEESLSIAPLGDNNTSPDEERVERRSATGTERHREGDESNESCPRVSIAVDGMLDGKVHESCGVDEPFETQTEYLRSDLAEKASGKESMEIGIQGYFRLSEETWSASSRLGSMNNDDVDANRMGPTEMPTFEEKNLVDDAVPASFDNERDDEGHALDHLDEETDGFEGMNVTCKDSIPEESTQLLPRPLLVIKGTTPTIVTLEWEWTLLPDQIAGADIVYSVLIIGTKFHGNIDSSFCYNFEESPAKAMWPKQRDNLIQHAWRTTNTVIEITGLKQRCGYRLAVLGQLMPFANDSLSRVLPFTMPGPPKPPVVHVTDVKDREITLSWKPPVSFGEATVTGYRVLKDGMAFGEDMDSETITVTISDFDGGREHRLNLIALTGHSVGDSKPSNSIITYCPTPPISPQIYPKDSAAVGSICIAWKQAEPASVYNSGELAQCSYSVFADDMLHGEYPLAGMTDIFTDEHVYTIPNCEVGRKYAVCVKSYLHPRVIDTGRGQRVHVCGCYGDSSNVLELYCAGPPSPPVVRVSRIDQSGVSLSWSTSREYGGVKLGGYILYVNGKWSGEILEPGQKQTTLTGFTPGNAICVQLSAITYDLPAPAPIHSNQEGAKLQHFSSRYEQPDSGIESSSSLKSKRSTEERKQYACSTGPPLVIQYSNLVKSVSSLELVKLGCRSASVTWSLDNSADRSIEPKVLTILCWKLSAEECVIKQIVTAKPFTITNLEPETDYQLLLQCIAPHINDDNYEEHPINITQSQTISFKTDSLPGPPTDVSVVASTENSIKLAWEIPIEHGIPVASIHLNVRRKDSDCTDEGRSFQVSAETCVFSFDLLAPKTEYNFVLRALTEDDLVEVHEEDSSSTVCLSAWTNGVETTENLHLQSRSPTSIAISWQPAMAYGMSTIQRYVVHYVQTRQLRKRSRGLVRQVRDLGNKLTVGSEICHAEMQGLEPGTVYKIILETVVNFGDYSYDEDFESDGSEVNSATSSTLSERTPEIQRLYLSQPLLVCTTAPLEPPVLIVSGFTSTQIHLSWNKPLLMIPVVDSRSTLSEDPARGRVRHLKCFRVEVNGRVYSRLAANKTSITLKKCKSGMKYSCVVVAITSPEKQHASQRKCERPDSAISDTDTDEGITKSVSDCFEETASNPVDVNLPRQEWGVCLSAKFCANKLAGSLWDSPCSENGDEEGGVVVEWNVNDLSGEARRYRLVWYTNECRDRNEVFLPTSASRYDIWPVSPSSVYTIYLEILDLHSEVEAAFGPLHCQTPGPPASPWIWCRSLSPYQLTIEWNEPRTYGNVKIRAYQVYLNDRRLERLVDKRQRRVTIHCQSSSACRVSLVALSTDPQYGDSPPSNVLKLYTPVAQDGTMGRKPSGGINRPAFNISIHVLSISNRSISFEWSHPPDIEEIADHYIIKWSSVLKPQTKEMTLPLTHGSHIIDDCIPGTSHFIVVAAVTTCGDLVSRSEQYTVQTSAPIERPVLQVESCLQSAITVNWRKPTIFGHAEIDYYLVMVNGKMEKELEGDCSYFKFTGCEPCQQYTFHLKAVSTKDTCDSDWSEPLVVTCPGAEKPLIKRIQSKKINCIRIGWEMPTLRGSARVENYKVYYLEDRGDMETGDDVITNTAAIQHGPLPWYTEEDKLVPVLPDSYYWVVLQVELSPDDCQPIYSQPIRTRAAMSPEPPLIKLEIEGVEARQRLEERICELSLRRDRFLRAVHLLESSVVVKGSKLKDLQIAKAADSLLEVDSELADALEDIKQYTGSISALIRWSTPRDDGDAVVSGYQVFVDGKLYGGPLPRSAVESHVRLPVTCRVIAVQTLTDHPVGPSPLSNAVELSGHEFLPFVMFCYFDVHIRGESWPRSGCCSWDDSHSYELKQRGRTSCRVFIPRGVLSRRIPCPAFNVVDVMSGLWRPLAPVGIKKMTVLLFWTKWCLSSQKVLEYFLRFAEELADKVSFVTCCVRSEETVTSHRQSLAGMLTERDWHRSVDSVNHTCGCYLQSQRSRSARRGVITDPDVCQLFGLVGVPTVILLDSSGYISWHGRCSCQDALAFRSLLLYVFSQVERSPCPVPTCSHCQLDKEEELDSTSFEVDETDETSRSRLRKPSVELNSLYQRLHGSSRKDDLLTFPRHSTPPGEIRKEQIRPKTTGTGNRSASYNRFSGMSEQYTLYSRTFSAYGAAHTNRPVTSRPSSVVTRSRTRAPQSTSHSSSGDFSLPVVPRQRGKRTHPLDRGLSPRMKSKISVEDFTLK